MLEVIIIAVVFLIALGWVTSNPRGSRVEHVRSEDRPYAEIEDGGRYLDLSKEQVETIFEPQKLMRSEVKKKAREACKVTENAFKTRTIPKNSTELIDDWRIHMERAAQLAHDGDEMYDLLEFSTDSAWNRWSDLLAEIHDAASDLEGAIDNLQELSKDINEFGQ